MDIDPDTLNLIKDGSMDSTVTQRPYTMGYLGLKFLDEIHHAHKGSFLPNYSISFRSPYPTFVDTGSTLINQDNTSLYEHPVQELARP
jgi:ribose transport system substrate-binding protein